MFEESLLLTDNPVSNVSKLNTSEIMLNKYTVVSHCIYCFFGVPLNVFVTAVVLCVDELWCKPRNSLLIGMLTGNLLSFLLATVEVIYYLSPSEDVCKVQHWIAGLPYTVFFLNLLLSLLDRYAAITRPFWHRDKVTVRAVVLWQTGLSLLLCLLIKCVFIFQIDPITCEVNQTEVNIYSAIVPTLFASCIVLRIALYFKTKELINQRRRGIVDPPQHNIELVELNQTTNALVVGSLSLVVSVPTAVSSNNGTIVTTNTSRTEDHSNGMGVHMTDETIDKLEEEATRTLVYSLTALLLLYTPVFAFLGFVLVYTQFYPIEECQSILNWGTYFEELANFHGIEQPLSYLYWSREFWSALRKWIDRRLRHHVMI